MPLVRFGVRNEYGLGHPELYRAADKEDPKAVLEGVAVAGLVGILRQLGDLAEFAAEVFHGLQEQVTATASRSHKLAVRVEHIEAALPPLEKAVLAQTSHIHFAYTAGTEWHPRIRNEQNHFIYNDLPRFIMDSYEECRHPPRLHVLDKFDAGGPGSCLRRYSDPNFFKRIAGNSTEETSEKIRREKRPRKSKKKKSSRRNGEFSRLASVSIHSGRMASPVAHAITSSQTASVADMTYKSDLGDHSDSFDLRSRSGHIEGDFNWSSFLQHGEQESMVSSSRFVPQIDIIDSTFSDEPTQMVDNNTLSTPSQEHIAPTSSGISWDEKAEIVESMGKRSNRDDAPELVSENFDIDRQGTTTPYLRNADESPEVVSADLNQDIEDRGYADLRNTDEAQEAANDDLDAPDRRAANFKTIDQMDVQPADENTSKSVSKRNQLDENESETDHYMDALNTIESESENDLDCQTKREIEQSSSAVNNGKVENRMDALVAHSPDYYLPNIDPHSVSNGVSSSLPDPVPSESITHEPTPQISGEPHDSDHSRDADVRKSADIVDVPNVESAVSHGLKVEAAMSSPPSSGFTISDPQDQSRDKIISRVHESQESHTEMSCFQPVKFWTNGGLLGLEPSKPLVVSPNSTSQDHIGRSKSEIVGPQNRSDGQKEKLDTLVENTERSGNDSICGTEKIPFSFDCLDAQSGKSAASCDSNTSDHDHRGGLDVSAKAASKTEIAPDAKATSSEASEENDRNSSLVFGLGHRLLVNGFPRSSLEHDERSESVRHLISCGFDQEHRQHHVTHRTIPDNAFIEQFGRGSPLHSRTSSPPLEHMKISFNPADGFEMSKLKLKFPDGSHYHESIRDTFPSFQLVPEPASPSYNHVSDSDDDTFCRSSPYMSDDHLSQQSESNSEEWESSGSPRASTEQELYDALSRMSSMGSVSSSLLVEGTKNDMCIDRGLQSICNGNDAEPNLLLLDLPSFDTMNTVLERETKAISDPKNLKKLQEDRVDAPLPPPPPPVQWQVSKPQSDVAEVEQRDRSEAFKDALQGKLADLRLANKQTLESKQESKVHQQKFYAVKEASKNANDVGMDEKEDFLHQIRTKSFNLRPTAPAKPTFSSCPATNTKVTAILEKANAIRKAVGSDTGDDDDNWSDA